jgi:hypothetical protein
VPPGVEKHLEVLSIFFSLYLYIYGLLNYMTKARIYININIKQEKYLENEGIALNKMVK